MLTRVSLTVKRGPQAGTEYRLNVPSSCTVGRASDCDVVVIGDPDPLFVSRYQCLIVVTPQGVRIRDLGSRNGTRINGDLVGPRYTLSSSTDDWWTGDGQLIADGDVIGFGGVALHVSLEVESSEHTSPREHATFDPVDSEPVGALP